MDKRTKTALEASIEHWERMYEDPIGARENGEVGGSASCALCQEFTYCNGCPVNAHTGGTACYSTPYADAASALLSVYNGDAYTDGLKAIVKEEVDFLKSLLK